MSGETYIYERNGTETGMGTHGVLRTEVKTEGIPMSVVNGVHDRVQDGNHQSGERSEDRSRVESSGRESVGMETESDINSPFPRKRDASDNRLPYTFAFSHPTVDDMPLSETTLPVALQQVAERMPARAAILSHYYTNRLMVALRRLRAVQEKEEAEREKYNSWAAITRKEIEGIEVGVKRELAESCALLREKEDRLKGELGAAHLRAAELTAKTGSVYDPEAPSATAVLRHEFQPLEVFAAEDQLPYYSDGPQMMLTIGIGWMLTCLIGVMTGLSVGLMAHLIEADTMMQKPGMALLCVFFGIASAIFGKCMVGYSFRFAAERYYLGRPPTVWGPFALLGAVTGITLILLDATVERAGLLSIRGLENAVAHLSGGGPSGEGDVWIYLLAAVLVTFGYVFTAGWEGYAKGRVKAVHNRLVARQKAEYDARDGAIRANPDVQEALQAVTQVQELQRQLRELGVEIARVEAPFVKKLAQLESDYPKHMGSLSETAKRRIEDAGDNFEGCQALFDRQLDQAVAQCEPMYGWWERVVRAVLGYQEPAHRDRNHRFWSTKR